MEKLRKAVRKGEAGAVRSLLIKVDAASLGSEEAETGQTVLHIASCQRRSSALDVVEMLVQAMTEEQISKRDKAGETAMHLLLDPEHRYSSRADGWHERCGRASAAMVAKMSEEAVLGRVGKDDERHGLTVLSLLAHCQQMAALEVAMDRFSDHMCHPELMRRTSPRWRQSATASSSTPAMARSDGGEDILINSEKRKSSTLWKSRLLRGLSRSSQ